jgi:nucleotide-binding universal stress UspA family protein
VPGRERIRSEGYGGGTHPDFMLRHKSGPPAGIAFSRKMRPIHHILVPTDFSTCAQGALQHGFHLAQKYGAELHIFHVVEGGVDYEKVLHIPGSPLRTLMLSSRDAVGATPLVEQLNGVPLHRVTRRDADAASAILQYAGEIGAHLVVMGAHGDSGANRYLSCGMDYVLIGRSADRVVRHSTCPVLTVGLRRGRFPGMVKSILVPVDFSPFSRSAIEHARELALLYGAQLEVLHVVERVANGVHQHEAPAVTDTAVLEDLRTTYDRVPGPTVPVAFHVERGSPTLRISAFAERQGVQLIVLGSHGTAGTGHLSLGGEAEQIVQMTSYAVLTVRAGDLAEAFVPAAVPHERATATSD